MFKLLNRISWILSLILWFIIVFSLVWGSSYRIWDEEIMASLFFWIIVWFIIKGLFLSESFINSRLEFFVNNLKERFLDSKINIKETKKSDFKNESIEKITEEEKASETKNISQKIIEEEKKKKDLFEKIGKDLEEENTKTIAENIWWTKEKIVKTPSKFETLFKNFFKENLLAKI